MTVEVRQLSIKSSVGENEKEKKPQSSGGCGDSEQGDSLNKSLSEGANSRRQHDEMMRRYRDR